MLKFSAPVREFKLQFFIGGQVLETNWFRNTDYQEKVDALRKAADDGRLFVSWREFKTTGYQEIK